MKVPAPTLAPILRSSVQGRILARIMIDPSAEHSITDLARWVTTSAPTVQREVDRAEQAGIVRTRKVGPTRLVRAHADHPLYPALAQVVLATFGPPAIVTREFSGLAGVDAVAIFGSWAARYLGVRGHDPRDVDVLVIGAPDRALVDNAADCAEHEIGMPVQPTIRTTEQWLRGEEPFVREIKQRPLLPLVVNDERLELGAQRE